MLQCTSTQHNNNKKRQILASDDEEVWRYIKLEVWEWMLNGKSIMTIQGLFYFIYVPHLSLVLLCMEKQEIMASTVCVPQTPLRTDFQLGSTNQRHWQKIGWWEMGSSQSIYFSCFASNDNMLSQVAVTSPLWL
jgi:hypothetical protein